MPLRRTFLLLATTLLTVSTATGQLLPQVPTIDPDAIEEDWVLVVSDPDPVGVGPQITTAMHPDGAVPAKFVAFDMNYREYPSFSPGGLQVQIWAAGQVTGTSTHGNALFNTRAEQVSWTQRMSLVGNMLTYDIQSGSSVTWNQFGQGAQLRVSFPTTVVSLAGYDSNVSATRSGVSWEQNHVTSLTLARVRYYANGQLIWTNNNPKVLVDNSGQ